MILFPAVDIKGGKCVRLQKGRADKETVFMDSPLEAALHWENKGAKWLHIIDLDGAFAGEPVNLTLIKELCNKVNIPIQMGGGIRNEKIAKAYLDAGVTRLIIGTMAVEEPENFALLAKKFPNKVGVSLDTEKGEIRTKGWVGGTGLKIDDLLPKLAEAGASFLIHTDIDRDGMQSGVNIDTLSRLSQISPIPVIAAGGVATLDDIKRLYPFSQNGKLEGAITGQAIYDGTLSVPEALDWIKSQK